MKIFIDERRRVDMAGYHREFGRHSNIPGCCIEFFIKDFPKIYRDREKLDRHNRLQAAAELKVGCRFNYRPCFNCMKRGIRHQLHRCSGPCADLYKILQLKYGF